MDYSLIKHNPSSDENIDMFFKRIILKMCQLYPYYKSEIPLIVNELQQYRQLLEQKLNAKVSLNYDNIKGALKRFDDKLAQFFNKEDIAKQIYLKQLKIINKLLGEPYNYDEYNKLPFGELYKICKEKYMQLTPENRDEFFDIYTSNKKVKPIMQTLKLWYDLKEKKARALIKDEIKSFAGLLKQDVFKDTSKDIKQYITKTNEQLQKDIRSEVKQTLTGSVIDRLREIISKSFDTSTIKDKIDSDLFQKLTKFKDLKIKYNDLIKKYEQAPETQKYQLIKEMENALYDITPIYKEVNERYNYFIGQMNNKNKKEYIKDMINKIDTLEKSSIEKLYHEFMDNIGLFNSKEQSKYKHIINDYYDIGVRKNDIINLNKLLLDKIKNARPGEYRFTEEGELNKGISKVINKAFNKYCENNSLSDDYKKELKDKILTDEYLYELYKNDISETQKQEKEEEQKKLIEKQELEKKRLEEEKLRQEELKKQKEAEEKINKQYQEDLKRKEAIKNFDDDIKKAKEEDERLLKIKQDEAEKLKQQKLKEQEYSKEFSDSMKNDDIYAEGCNIFDIQNKTLTQILKEINDKYNKLPNQKLDGVIYINLKKRFPKKEDFNKFFIQQLKKYDKKYNYDKYKEYMSEKKYSKKYIDELNKAGGILSSLLSTIGLNDNILDKNIKGSGILSSLLSTIGLNDKVLKDKDIKGSGIFSKILGFIGLNDDIFEKDELLNKIKPFIDLFKKEKNNKMIDGYLYAIVKLEMDDDDDENKIKETFNNLLFKYDELYRPKLHKQRLDKNYYDVKAGFPFMAVLPFVGPALSGISSIINSIKGKGCDEINKKVKGKNQNNLLETRGGKIISLAELKEISKEIK